MTQLVDLKGLLVNVEYRQLSLPSQSSNTPIVTDAAALPMTADRLSISVAVVKFGQGTVLGANI